jgi:hypothetical protein
MTVAELIPELHALKNVDKIRVIQLLATELTQDESHHGDQSTNRPLRGTVLKYEDPFNSFAEGEWNALQ